MQQEQLVNEIARLVAEQLKGMDLYNPNDRIPIGVSARHVHLTREDVEILFGKGYQLHKKKELMGGQYAAQECVTLIGTKLRAIENVRVLGPERSRSQVEISKTDAIKLGVNAPVRLSGDLDGSAPIALAGPQGVVYLKEGCIIAKRHIHMSPADAKRFGVEDKQVVKVRFESGRGGTFEDVPIRVDDSFSLEMHIDTDEANGLGITKDMGILIK
ncbi:MAG TPA: phosphate propanoyltransferase [Candidatus Limivivens intestinipullorum]|uniref:Phosphate propanoyltransferase n=1 Tax=Candidatus Limivivens intestinipullorum TaxID=2840858 RepID=A0A9D1JJ80_9FIRM|nr:phosphate propanoyltransferase [Candidatus Limivivens intestinipullorum]